MYSTPYEQGQTRLLHPADSATGEKIMAITKLKVGSKFYAARSPKHRISNTSVNHAIADMADRGGLSQKKGCLIVFFQRGAKVTAAQRCPGRHLPKKRNPHQCRDKRTHLFAKCARKGTKRARRQRAYL